jgi:hypothetical protein
MFGHFLWSRDIGDPAVILSRDSLSLLVRGQMFRLYKTVKELSAKRPTKHRRTNHQNSLMLRIAVAR